VVEINIVGVRLTDKGDNPEEGAAAAGGILE
jgi:hypothetical protein